MCSNEWVDVPAHSLQYLMSKDCFVGTDLTDRDNDAIFWPKMFRTRG